MKYQQQRHCADTVPSFPELRRAVPLTRRPFSAFNTTTLLTAFSMTFLSILPYHADIMTARAKESDSSRARLATLKSHRRLYHAPAFQPSCQYALIRHFYALR